ncbi:MAG: NAD(P)H-dependent oxidoreductase subunit E [Thermodesulfovibrionales bacterium]|nr:NAD(P)H-dependent oxidoreductase subunit E [Thermodesulfovibrionales bacterium]
MEKILEKLLTEFRKNQYNLIGLLQRIQDIYGYIPKDVVFWFSKKLDIPASKFYGVITFYPKFYLKPKGKNIITVCCGAACHIKGANHLLDVLKTNLSLGDGEDTTSDLTFTVQKATCVGACNIAPVVIVNDRVYGKMNGEEIKKIITGYKREDEFTGFEYE